MSLCACSSGAEFRDCCEPYLTGARKAPTPEALMRSRYTAYATHRLEYIEKTLHPRARAHHDPKNTAEWSLKSEWKGLAILGRSGGEPGSTRGSVEFIAHYRTGGEEVEHHEIAEFRREGDTWFFYDGRVIGGEPIRRDAPKTNRNDPCPCGSGKKYKKCCGA